MTGSLQIRNGKYYAVYRNDQGKQKWVLLDIPASGNNKRKAQLRMKQRTKAADAA